MQQPEPERGMGIRGPDSSGMRTWVIPLGKSHVSRGAEGEGNPDCDVGEKDEHYLWSRDQLL